MSPSYDDWKTTEPEEAGLCSCGNRATEGSDLCRECRAEVRAEQNGERV